MGGYSTYTGMLIGPGRLVVDRWTGVSKEMNVFISRVYLP